MTVPASHPCPYPSHVLNLLDILLPSIGIVLDPFAGSGRIHQLATVTRRTVGVELEPEWASQHAAPMTTESPSGEPGEVDLTVGWWDNHCYLIETIEVLRSALEAALTCPAVWCMCDAHELLRNTEGAANYE